MVRQGQQVAFEDFKAEIERRINTSHNTVTKISSNLDEIEKLASLRDRKVITEEEFQAKKKQLLGL
jgi:hypothetical protein